MIIDIYGLAEGQLVELISERDALRVQLAAAEAMLAEMRLALDEANKLNKILLDMRAAAERDLRTLSLHMGEVCAERDTAQSRIVELERENAQLMGKLGDAYEVRDDLQFKLAAAERDLAAMTAERDNEAEWVEGFRRDLAAANARAAKLEQELERIPALQECVEQMMRELEDKGARAYIFMGALWDIIAKDPNPTSGYGVAVVKIARAALDGRAETSNSNNASPTQ